MRYLRRINEWGDDDDNNLSISPETARDFYKEEPPWKKELSKIDKLPQRQDSLTDQMRDLYVIANHFGFYDAADYIRQNFI